MNIKTSLSIPTTLTYAENSYDIQSAENLCEYIAEQLSALHLIHKVTTNTPVGQLTFDIFIDKYTCIEEPEFNIEVTVLTEHDTDDHTIWDALAQSNTWQKPIVEAVQKFIKEVNDNFQMFVPKKESFKFESGRFWIEQDAFEPYTPEFIEFEIKDTINEDQVTENLIVS